MPTEEIKSLLNFEKYKGIYGALSAIAALTVIIIQLPDSSIDALKNRWLIITIPSVVILMIAMFSAYLQEQKARTKIQVESSENIRGLTETIKTAISELKGVASMIDTRFDAIETRLDQLYFSLEKRRELIHTGDTEEFKRIKPKGKITM